MLRKPKGLKELDEVDKEISKDPVMAKMLEDVESAPLTP